MKVDLHIHSTASDGSYSPKEVVQLALNNRLRVIALTDHDTLGGLPEAAAEAEKWGLEFVPGIEMSCYWRGHEVHILGYFLNLEDEAFVQKIEELKSLRWERNKKIIALLEKYDIMIAMDDLEAKYPGQSIGRVHIANEIIAQGKAETMPEVFEKYLGAGGLAYVEKEGMLPHRALRLLKEHGALVSLAHPKYVSKDENEVLELIRELKAEGLDAMECNYAGFSMKEIRKYRSWAKNFGLEITGGSDFHGENRKHSEIGMQGLTYQQFKKLRRNI